MKSDPFGSGVSVEQSAGTASGNVDTKMDTSTEAQQAVMPTALEGGPEVSGLLPRQLRHDLRNCVGQIIGYSELWLEETEDQGETEFRSDLQRIYMAGKQILAMINTYVDPVHARVIQVPAEHAPAHAIETTSGTTSVNNSANAEEILEKTVSKPFTLFHELSHWRIATTIAIVTELVPVSNSALELAPDAAEPNISEANISEANISQASDSDILSKPFALPLLPAQMLPTQTEAGMLSQPANRMLGAILIVDDNEANRDLLSRRLEHHGHRTMVARNGQEALGRLRDQTLAFDVVLLDIVMPVLDGYEVLRQIKADERLRHLPVIMISALDEMDSVIRCIEMGADDFLSKPFDPVLLQARIGACLEKKRLRDRELELFQQLQQNYQRLKELETLRDDLTYMIVHDLRTPLTSILTGLSTLEYSKRLDEGDRELLEISLSGGHTLLGMINDLLDVSKMEDGSLALQKTTLQAETIIDRAIQQVSALTIEKRLTLMREIPAGLPAFSGDADKLVRTLVNLLGNAIKFTPPGGVITISVRADGNDEGPPASYALLFAIRDTGEGIPRDAFERIFQKFGQVESRKAGRKMSTGLGLTFCKMVVEAHGGRIWVESELGHGSTFLFSLPALTP